MSPLPPTNRTEDPEHQARTLVDNPPFFILGVMGGRLRGLKSELAVSLDFRGVGSSGSRGRF